MEWIMENKTWIFSGIGVFIIASIVNLILKKNNKEIKQKQKSGDNSTSIQIGGDINQR